MTLGHSRTRVPMLPEDGEDYEADEFEDAPDEDPDSCDEREDLQFSDSDNGKALLERLIEGEDTPLREIHYVATKVARREENLNFTLPSSQLTPLEFAVQKQRQSVTGLLLSQLYADVDYICGLQSTPLAQCCFANNPELNIMCETLLVNGANPNARVDNSNDDSMTCLIQATCNRNLDLVHLLLEYHADVTLEWSGMTAHALANDLELSEIAQVIKQFSDTQEARKKLATKCAGEDIGEAWILTWEDLEMAKKIGQGGFGAVHQGRVISDPPETQVAIKECLLQDTSLLSSFRQEVQFLASFRHENIVLFRGACFELPHLCIVTELMEKGNLYDLLHGQEEVKWSDRIRWGWEIARGMNYLHTLSPPVVHRDIKTPNILVNKELQVKVGDFGMSRTKQHTVVHTKDRGGSPFWMAPECLRGEPFAEKSDVYSFGVVLWEIMTRQVPWGDKEMVQLVGLVGFRNQTLEIPPRPEGCPEEYVNIMQACWKPVPEDRPTFAEITARFGPLCQH